MLSRLSPRQLAVVHALLVTGSVDRAAVLLGITTHTVNGHLAAARRRVGVGTTEQLVEALARTSEMPERDPVPSGSVP